MLVFSRRKNQKFHFPSLNISIEILRISGNTVRVGIDAPKEFRVFRDEVAEKLSARGEQLSAPKEPSLTHELRNRLNVASVALHLLEKQLEFGWTAEAQETLEKALAEFANLDRELAGKPRPVLSEAQPDRPHALLVDDNANESELLAAFLRSSGYRVDTAYDGFDALDYLSTHRKPDVVLLDMLMPRCDGPTTISAIRENPAYQDLKVFAVSGTNPDGFGIDTGPGGVDRWFTKPLNPQTLVLEMNRALMPAL